MALRNPSHHGTDKTAPIGGVKPILRIKANIPRCRPPSALVAPHAPVSGPLADAPAGVTDYVLRVDRGIW
jgi:hypothetical protein